MDIVIAKGSCEHLKDCEEALLHSDLGAHYFETKGSAKKAIEEAIKNNSLYIALKEQTCIGFFYCMPTGAFHAFPYLHLIAVKRAYRGMGIGKIMLDYLEKQLLTESQKLFLVVSDYNLQAKQFYAQAGYVQVGEIPNLYRRGITEYLMVKELKK